MRGRYLSCLRCLELEEYWLGIFQYFGLDLKTKYAKMPLRKRALDN